MNVKRVVLAGVLALMLPLRASAATIEGLGFLNDLEFDLWKIVTSGTSLTIKAESPVIDTNLFLFDDSWFGKKANDDANGGTLNSQITTAVTAGATYYVGVSSWGVAPLSDGGRIFPVLDGPGVVGPTGPGGGQAFNGTSTWSFPMAWNYKLTFDGVVSASPTVYSAVPEPATLTLFGTGLLALGRRAWKQRQSKATLA